MVMDSFSFFWDVRLYFLLFSTRAWNQRQLCIAHKEKAREVWHIGQSLVPNHLVDGEAT